jgi:succinyl-CoA synthetase beta subunit
MAGQFGRQVIDILIFEIMSGGYVHIDRDLCLTCPTKACISICQMPIINGPLVLEGNVPGLRYSPEAIRRGGCVECLACEQECQLRGISGALSIGLPIPELDISV